MKIDILGDGIYIMAVSGGVDSVVLLDLLTQQKDLRLVVAHFDHGIRENSKQDRIFVEQLAKNYQLPFQYRKGLLGANASEDEARQARYTFLRLAQAKHHARAIITAHHQDDVLETIVLNVLRGTGRKGLSSLQSTTDIVRPLLHRSKAEIIAYAKDHNLQWHEDETNSQTVYMRNWIRAEIIPKLSTDQRQTLLTMYEQNKTRNHQIDVTLESMLLSAKDKPTLNSRLFAQLSHTVAKELCATWLRKNGIADFDSRTLERLTVGMKTLTPNKTLNAKKGFVIVRDGDSFRLQKTISGKE